MEEYIHIDGEHSEVEKEEVTKHLRQWEGDGLLEVEGETPKSPEQKAIIEEALRLLEWKLQQLGIESEQFDQGRIHLLPGSVYEEHFKDGSVACFFDINNSICVNIDKHHDPLRLLEDILHELIHAYSKRNSVYVKLRENANSTISKTRVGYEVRSPWKHKQRMVGFNEALTELTSLRLVEGFSAEIKDRLKIAVKEERVAAYVEYIELVEDLIGKVAETEQIDPQEVMHTMQKGMFTGSMLPVIKMLGRTIGREGVEILSYLGSFTYEDVSQHILDNLIFEYFRETDNAKKQQLVKAIRDFAERYRKILKTIH